MKKNYLELHRARDCLSLPISYTYIHENASYRLHIYLKRKFQMFIVDSAIKCGDRNAFCPHAYAFQLRAATIFFCLDFFFRHFSTYFPYGRRVVFFYLYTQICLVFMYMRGSNASYIFVSIFLVLYINFIEETQNRPATYRFSFL